jgi:hypothetical protein
MPKKSFLIYDPGSSSKMQDPDDDFVPIPDPGPRG